jgi:hypothetical protein
MMNANRNYFLINIIIIHLFILHDILQILIQKHMSQVEHKSQLLFENVQKNENGEEEAKKT